ncbi:MAG TPA: non-heme iron oxygenase ferredoxin subunit [Dehalococcoidia bacterium]|nr:non-heme iron oxygenase ferredoxin subunit [Dehalococcoidia bacterium]
MAFVRVGTKSDVPAGTVRVFDAGGVSVCVANVDGENFYAVDNLCTHDNGPLGEGRLADGDVECPRHGARFDVKTGEVRAFPAVKPVRAYAVRLDAEEISVDVG